MVFFVTAVAVDGKSQVFQEVLIRFNKQDKETHLTLVKEIGNVVVGWLYVEELLERAFLKKRSVPSS